MEPPMTGDEIVISGIAGRFPNCENINELQDNLLNKKDCVSDNNTRWNFDHPQIPQRIGITKNIDTFDRIFFGVNGRIAENMDPMVRMLIEITYEAITDAGINSRKLKGSKCAVFTGTTFSETDKRFFFEKLKHDGFGIVGASRAMLANRLSFFFDLTGPSINIDSSCCGGVTALQEGFRVIKNGLAESAIIGSSNVILHPNMSLQLFLLGLLSPDGITKSFDNAADGYTRSEGTVVLFLQKARDAKRIYAEVKNAGSYFGNVNNVYSFFYPTFDTQANYMRMSLKKCGLSGKDISFVEADGSGIKDVDAEEIKAIDEVYNEGRNSPLLIGSVKSNLGSSSGVNPLNGIIKVITAMESGYIPPNLHFKKCSDKIPALKEGRCKIVTELTPWTGGYAVVNSLALTGVYGNVILKANKKDKKNEGRPNDTLPRLVIVSGCTEEAVDAILNDLERRPVDVEMLQLMYDIFEFGFPAHLYRGYTILPPNGLSKIKTREIHYNESFQREIWYMFSGMGSQWVGMGEALLQLPVFAAAINKCDQVLKPRGLDIVRIITEKDPKIFENIINSFVGIAAIQIGLVDVLSSIGLKPDFLIGHSVGELGCAYADGCFTAEQMVLAALCRGLASVETEMPQGSMAAVGLGYEEIKILCPSDIDVACHNSEHSSTISGPEYSMKEFVRQLKAKNIFTKEVACSNIAYHSRYIAPAGEKLRKYLQEVIPNSKPRSQRWVSSSVPYNEWNSAKARLSSAEYHTNNLLNSVLFAEAAKRISSNAIVIEIAPHGLLQAIVRKSLPENVLNVPLTKRGHPDNVSFLLSALGNIYNAGYNINVSNLYPKVNYPVSRGTPSISPLIRWDHSTKWFTDFFKQPKEVRVGEKEFVINLKEEKWIYLNHFKIEGQVVVPTSLYFKIAWEVLVWLKQGSATTVVFENVQIHKHQVIIPEDENIVFVVMLQKGTGFFEVTNNKTLLCSGIIQVTDALDEKCSQDPKEVDKIYQDLNERDIYRDLQMRGLQYSGPFRTIRKLSTNGSNGTLIWKDDWTSFLEGMIQMRILGNDTREAQVPIKIRKIVINLKLHEEIINSSTEIPVSEQEKLEIINAGCVKMEGIVLKSILHKTSTNNVITEEIQIVSGTDGVLSKLPEILNMTLQFLKENSGKSNLISIVEDDTIDVEKINECLKTVLKETSESRFNIDMVPTSRVSSNKPKSNDIALLILCNIMQHSQKDLLKIMSGETFLLTFVEPQNKKLIMKMLDSAGLGLVLKKCLFNDRIALLFRQRQTFNKTTVLNINDEQDWSNQIRTLDSLNNCDRLIVVIRSIKNFNIYHNFAVLQEKDYESKIQVVDIQDPKITKFSLEDTLFSTQLDLNLKMNILLPGNIWGTYKHFPLFPNLQQVSNWKAAQLKTSKVDFMSWVETFSKKDENTIKVEYSAVNKDDILLATRKMSLENTGISRLEINSFGQEYSGIDSWGNRFMGISINSAFSKFTTADIDFIWKIPNEWSLEDAATIPLAYTVAYLALVIKGEVQNKKTVFIYNGCCFIGQAAINLALHFKSEILVGHTSNSEKNFLKINYPNIPENHFIQTTEYIRDQLLLAQTEANGVDLIIYNAADLSRLSRCLTYLKKAARIIVIGNLEEAFSTSVGMEIFDIECKLFSIIPKNLINLDLDTKKNLSQIVGKGIKLGIVKPLPKRIYSREMLKNAFTDGVSKAVFEKIIVKVQPDNGSNTALAIPRFLCKSGAFYLIIDGLIDFGLELIDFLVVKGARNIVIVSESKNTRSYSKHRIRLWNRDGVSVTVRDKFDLNYQQNGNDLLEELSSHGNVDAIFDLQRIGISSRRSSSSKYLFTKNLFKESKRMCPNLRQFIVFSTFKNTRESVNDILLKEIYLTKIFQEKSNLTLRGLLVFLGSVAGITECATENEKNVPVLSILTVIEQIDNLIGSEASIAYISPKLLKVDVKKGVKEFVYVDETEKEKLEKYITAVRPLATPCKFEILIEKQYEN